MVLLHVMSTKQFRVISNDRHKRQVDICTASVSLTTPTLEFVNIDKYLYEHLLIGAPDFALNG